MYFTAIIKSEHYKREHERAVPWSEVILVIVSSAKNMRKKGKNIEIETKNYYILAELRGGELWVINAKRAQ